MIAPTMGLIMFMLPGIIAAQCYCSQYHNSQPIGRVVYKSPVSQTGNNAYNNTFYVMPDMIFDNSWDGSDYSPGGYRQVSYPQSTYELPYYYPQQQQGYYPQNNYYPQQTKGDKIINTIQTIGQIIQSGTQIIQSFMQLRPSGQYGY